MLNLPVLLTLAFCVFVCAITIYTGIAMLVALFHSDPKKRKDALKVIRYLVDLFKYLVDLFKGSRK